MFNKVQEPFHKFKPVFFVESDMGADIQSGQRKVGREVINPKRRVELRQRAEKKR